MKIHFALPIALIGASILALAPLVTNAEDLVVEPVSVQTSMGTTYLNGGVGDEETEAMRSVAKDYPLRMTFSERDGGFIGDVSVTITDAKGESVFELPKAGPMLYVMLPNGKYNISASSNGKTQSRKVMLSGKRGKNIQFHWKGAPEE